MKFCLRCGTKLPDFALFCPICGYKQPEIEEKPAEPISQEEVPAPVIEESKTNEEQFEEASGKTVDQFVEELLQTDIPEENTEEPSKFGEPEDPGEAAASKKPAQGIEISPRVEEPKPKPVQTPAKPAPARKKGGFFVDPESMKLLLILTGSLFLGSLLLWIIDAFISVFILLKLLNLFYALWRSFKITWTIVNWFKAQKGQEKDMFTMFLMFCLGGATGILTILGIVFLFV